MGQIKRESGNPTLMNTVANHETGFNVLLARGHSNECPLASSTSNPVGNCTK